MAELAPAGAVKNPRGTPDWVSAALGPALISASGLVYMIWVYNLTAQSGYWDDSLFVVAVSRTIPTGFAEAAKALLEASGDTYGPFLFGLTWLVKRWDMLGNGILNAVSALAVIALALAVYSLARLVGLPRYLATIGGLFTLFTPALADQRLWFVSIQHTYTVTLLVVAVSASLAFARKLKGGPGYLRSLVTPLVILDASLLMLSLGREIVLGASILAIAATWAFVAGMRKRLIIMLAWLLPVPLLFRAVLTGRAGTQVGTIGLPGLESQPLQALTAFLDQNPGRSTLLVLVLVVVLQALLLKLVKGSSSTVFEKQPAVNQMTGRLSEPVRLLLSLGAAAAAIGAAPRILSLLAAALPGINWSVDNGLTFASRWGMTNTPVITLIAVGLIVLAAISIRPARFTSAFLGMSMIATVPYLASNFMEGAFSWETGGPTHAFSRYVIYVIPAAVLFTLCLLEIPWRRYRRTTMLLAALAVVFASVLSIAATSERVLQVQAVVVVKEGPSQIRITPTAAVKEYRVGYGESLPGQILGDYEAITDDIGLSSEHLGAEVVWTLD